MAIKLLNISKKYDAKIVLDDISYHIKEGVTTCIMGPSGCGKTTLLRIMMGLEMPDKGAVAGLENLKKSVIFQEDRLCENLTVASNIRMTRRKPLKVDQILDAIQKVELPPDCLKQQAQHLSGGQKRRVAILRALMTEYDILFMDEPFKGLDLETKKQVMHYVKQATQGKTVILVTHDEMECQAMSNEMIYHL